MTLHDRFRLRVQSLGDDYWARQLIKAVRTDVDRGIVVDLTSPGSIYPNGAVPLAAILAYFGKIHPNKIYVQVDTSSPVQVHIGEPMSLDRFDRSGGDHLTNTVWRYRSEVEAQQLANMFMNALTEQVKCEEGVIDSINWCLYEVMDNVFQHSEADEGFVMMQLHKVSRRCVVAVGDTGIGIQKSMLKGDAVDWSIVRDAGAAINLALQQGVTSKGGINQGNGLYGLRRAVEVNGGRLSVLSGRGLWTFRDGEEATKTDWDRPIPDPDNHQSTLVDWQLDCSNKVRIDEALGIVPHSDFLESIEDDLGEHRLSVQEIEESLGSRKLGSAIRTRIENYLAAGAPRVVLDFKNVGVVSSSFADEVLAKLALSMGELDFRRRVFIDSASSTNRALVERAIHLRLTQSGEAANETHG